MTMITRDFTHETPDWVKQAGRHCGQLCVDIVCAVCKEYVPRIAVKIPANIVRGSE